LFSWYGSKNETNQMLCSLFATSTGKHLPLLSNTPAAITEFDGCMSHPIDAGNSSLDHRPTISAGITDWIVGLTILSQHGAAFLCSGERAGYRQLT